MKRGECTWGWWTVFANRAAGSNFTGGQSDSHSALQLPEVATGPGERASRVTGRSTRGTWMPLRGQISASATTSPLGKRNMKWMGTSLTVTFFLSFNNKVTLHHTHTQYNTIAWCSTQLTLPQLEPVVAASELDIWSNLSDFHWRNVF